ncbi:MAG: fructose-1,6-bisphosphatase [Bacillota bacterium]
METNQNMVLKLLAEKYKNRAEVASEIINLKTICSLPKGTEHFMSDLHGEYEAFNHIVNNCSGVVREKVDMVLGDTASEKEKQTISTIIYYPKEKLAELEQSNDLSRDWYKKTIDTLVKICETVSYKYSRSKVRKLLPNANQWLLEEFLHGERVGYDTARYHSKIVDTILDCDMQADFIATLATVIKKLTVARLHIVGDIYDRGEKPDDIFDLLIDHNACDIQWGNHDIVWMGACAGSTACMANVINLSLTYNNTEVLEVGYGISLRPLMVFSKATYKNAKCFFPKDKSSSEDELEMALMRKAIAVIMFKLEGQAIKRNSNFNMKHRNLLEKLDLENQTVEIDGKTYQINDTDFPTLDMANPYKLSKEEKQVLDKLAYAFTSSERLRAHITFLYEKGSLFLVYNKNLLFHGAIPMNENGSFMTFETHDEEIVSGKEYMMYCEKMARQAFYARPGSKKWQAGCDFCWYLWCGGKSPLFGRDKMATFERLLINDESVHTENKNSYYKLYNKPETFKAIAKEFGLDFVNSHIVNGHVPVKSIDGESPLKAEGKIIVIDGGFCKKYHKTTGISGYTLIYNSWGMRLCAHNEFTTTEDAIRGNIDIHSTTNVFERSDRRITVGETDNGKELSETIAWLEKLMKAYDKGTIKESTVAVKK